MRRFQQGLGLLIAVFALVSVLSLTGCKKEETTGDKMDDIQEQTDEAVEEAEEAADAAKDAAESANP